MYSGIGLQTMLRELLTSKCTHYTTCKIILIEINYVLSVDAQTVPSRIRLMQENSAVSTGRISGSLTLMKGQQMCVNTTAILEVSNYDYFFYCIEKYLRNEVLRFFPIKEFCKQKYQYMSTMLSLLMCYN